MAVSKGEGGDGGGVASVLVIILRLVGMTLAVSSLTAFALTRVNYLVSIARQSFPANLSAADLQHQSVQAYLTAGIHVIDQILVVGGGGCFLSLIPAVFLRGAGPTGDSAVAVGDPP